VFFFFWKCSKIIPNTLKKSRIWLTITNRLFFKEKNLRCSYLLNNAGIDTAILYDDPTHITRANLYIIQFIPNTRHTEEEKITYSPPTPQFYYKQRVFWVSYLTANCHKHVRNTMMSLHHALHTPKYIKVFVFFLHT